MIVRDGWISNKVITHIELRYGRDMPELDIRWGVRIWSNQEFPLLEEYETKDQAVERFNEYMIYMEKYENYRESK